jgi:hypothetical protein
MAELQFTLSGEAGAFEVNDAPLTPFTASFDVDTLSGTQGLQFDIGIVSVFQSFGTHFTNVQLDVGGNSVLSVPAVNGEIWGNPVGNPSMVPVDSGVIMPGLDLEWSLGPPGIPQDTPDPIAAIFLHASGPYGFQGAVNGLWSLSQFSIKVTDISASVPEPGMIGLFSLAVVALICAHRGRQWRGRPIVGEHR